MGLETAALRFSAAKLEQMPAQGKCKSVVSFAFPPPAFLAFVDLCRAALLCAVSLRMVTGTAWCWHGERGGAVTPCHYSSITSTQTSLEYPRVPMGQGCPSPGCLQFK